MDQINTLFGMGIGSALGGAATFNGTLMVLGGLLTVGSMIWQWRREEQRRNDLEALRHVRGMCPWPAPDGSAACLVRPKPGEPISPTKAN